MRSRRHAAIVAGAVWVVVVAGFSATTADAQQQRPSAIVALGDSAISGEGQGPYEPGTDGPSNFCHRSVGALIHRTGLSVDTSVNLACSGAKSEHIVRGGGRHYGEIPQNERLAEVARQYEVKLVVLQVGANDEIAFADMVLECVRHFALPFQRGCRKTIGSEFANRVTLSMRRVFVVIDDIPAPMGDAGHDPRGYQLGGVSYAPPGTAGVG